MYRALTASVPLGNAVVVNVAAPPERFAVPRIVPLATNSTAPVGVVLLELPTTEALNVTALSGPTLEDELFRLTALLARAGSTVKEEEAEVDRALPLSPLYTALTV